MQDGSPLTLSISVVYFGSDNAELKALLVSLVPAVEQLRAEFAVAPIPVYLIDNSNDQNLALSQFAEIQTELSSQEIKLRLINGHGNIGYGRGHNLALENLESDYHLILNPDIRIHQNCLYSGITFLESNTEVAVASPYAEYADGTKQYLCKRYPAVLTFLIRGFFPNSLKQYFSRRLAQFEMRELAEDRPNSNIPIVSGCFMLCRSKVLQEIGGFDRNYFLYFEDFDLSLRLGRVGRLAYVPAMRIQHDGGHAARKGWSHLTMFARSGFRFFNTHGWRFFSQADRTK